MNIHIVKNESDTLTKVLSAERLNAYRKQVRPMKPHAGVEGEFVEE